MKHLKEDRLRLRIKGQQSTILSEDMLTELGSKLSPLMRMREWEVVYRTNVDGVSFHTFYHNVAKYNPTIVLVQDTSKAVFGAFASEQWHSSPHFYGTGESFLFSFKVSPSHTQT